MAPAGGRIEDQDGPAATPCRFRLGAGGRSVSDRLAGSNIEYSLRRLSFLRQGRPRALIASKSGHGTVPVFLDTGIAFRGIPIADGLAKLPEPQSGPCELDAEDGEPNRQHNEGRTRRDEHDRAQKHNRNAHHGDDDASRELVRQMNDSLDHKKLPGRWPDYVRSAFPALMIVL